MSRTITQNVVLSQMCAVPQRNHGFDSLTKHFMRNTNNRSHSDTVESVEDILNFFGTDLLATALDDVILATDPVEITLLVHTEQVTGIKHRFTRNRTGLQHLRCFLRALPVSLHDRAAADHQLPDMAA